MSRFDEYKAFYDTLTDNQVSKRLDIVQAQLKIAYHQTNISETVIEDMQTVEKALISVRFERCGSRGRKKQRR